MHCFCKLMWTPAPKHFKLLLTDILTCSTSTVLWTPLSCYSSFSFLQFRVARKHLILCHKHYWESFAWCRFTVVWCPPTPCMPWTWSASSPGSGTRATKNWSKTTCTGNALPQRKACSSAESCLQLRDWQLRIRETSSKIIPILCWTQLNEKVLFMFRQKEHWDETKQLIKRDNCPLPVKFFKLFMTEVMFAVKPDAFWNQTER